MGEPVIGESWGTKERRRERSDVVRRRRMKDWPLHFSVLRRDAAGRASDKYVDQSIILIPKPGIVKVYLVKYRTEI